jgi:hypothetical protein
LNNVLDNTLVHTQANLIAMVQQGGQDQLIEVEGTIPNDVVVPEPASLLVWGLLSLVGVAYGRRRKLVS